MPEQATESTSMSEIGRLAGIFWEPRPVYENLVAHPRWWVPLILLTVLALGYTMTYSTVVGWERFMRQQLETNTRLQQLPPDQLERIIEQQTKFTSGFAYAGATLAVAASSLVIAAVLLGVFNFVGGANLKFKQAFSITCYSYLPTAVSTILALVIMLLKNPDDFELQNPIPLNIGAYLDPKTTAKWLHSVATSIDLFSIWVMLLLALGFSVAAKNMRFSKSLALVLSTWVVYVGVKSGWASLFG